jgi:hypothetical protein
MNINPKTCPGAITLQIVLAIFILYRKEAAAQGFLQTA